MSAFHTHRDGDEIDNFYWIASLGRQELLQEVGKVRLRFRKLEAKQLGRLRMEQLAQARS